MVEVSSGWVCGTEGRTLSDVLLHVHMRDDEELQDKADDTRRCGPVLLEQTEEACPCVLFLRPSDPPSAIRHLLVISQARTMEVYDESGEYCGTGRGHRVDGPHVDSSDVGPFYRKQLILDCPTASCQVKLLSLAGRRRVLIGQVVVGLRTLPPSRGPGIDLQRVQSLVDQVGTRLSPGAQNLLDLVQVQQKNQGSGMGAFLPLLMGDGALASLNPAMKRAEPQPHPAQLSDTPVEEAPPTRNTVSRVSGSASPDLLQKNPVSSDAISPAQLIEMMSHLVRGRGHTLSSTPDLLPMLQSVCGQVTQLRLDSEKPLRNGSWDGDLVMERRLDDLERRLKHHLDQRLDALEQKLDKVLQLFLDQGTRSGSGSAGRGGAEEVPPS